MDQAARGAAALNAGKYHDAVKEYTAAISVHPNAADYYIKRSTAYQRTSDYAAALKDAEIAVVLAVKRGKRELVTQAQLRRAIALFQLERYGNAEYVFGIVKKRDEKEKSLGIWETKVASKLATLDESDERRKVTAKELPEVEVPSAEEVKTGSISAVRDTESASQAATPTPAEKTDLQTPPNKIKHDWYQNSENVYFTLLAKGVPKDKATIEIQERSLSVSFPTITSSTYEFSLEPLFSHVDPSKSTYNITPSKVEITLRKATPGVKWHSLEGAADETTGSSADSSKPTIPQAILTSQSTGAAPAYPTSSRSGPKDWDKLANDLTKKPKKDGNDKEEYEDLDLEDGGDEVNAFFRKLYSNADPDTRRAMIKSYQESNGTALSTNWAEVGKGKVETSPPEGMVAKKWGE